MSTGHLLHSCFGGCARCFWADLEVQAYDPMWPLIWHVRVLADFGRQKQRRSTETDAKPEEAAQAISRARDAGTSFGQFVGWSWWWAMMAIASANEKLYQIIAISPKIFWYVGTCSLHNAEAQKFKHLFLARRETMQGPSGWRCGLRLRTSMQHFFMFTCCFTYSTCFVMTGWKHRLLRM